MSMSHKHITGIISKIEKEFPVNSILYNTIRIWPYLRNQIVFFLFNGIPSNSKNDFLKGKTFRYLFSYFRQSFLKNRTLVRELNRFKKNPFQINSADFLFLSDVVNRYVIVDSKQMSPFADSMAFYLERKGRCFVLEHSSDEKAHVHS